MTPNRICELLSSGCAYARDGHYGKAENLFKAALEADSDSILALAELGRISRIRNDSKSLEHYQREIARIASHRNNSCFGEHDPWSIVDRLNAMDPHSNEDRNRYIWSRRNALARLAIALGWTSIPTFDNHQYSIQELQEAYMVFLFPYLIEPIFQELSLARLDKLIGSDDQLSIGLYGCGPGPELLGITRYVSEELADVSRIDGYLFDRNDWGAMQRLCHDMAMNEYRTRPDLDVVIHPKKMDLFQPALHRDRSARLPDGVTKICVMQNCLRDLAGPAASAEAMHNMLRGRFRSLTEGGIMVIIDLKYPEVKSIMMDFEEELEADDSALIIRSRLNRGAYAGLHAQKPQAVAEIETEFARYEKDGKAYYSLVAMRL